MVGEKENDRCAVVRICNGGWLVNIYFVGGGLYYEAAYLDGISAVKKE